MTLRIKDPWGLISGRTHFSIYGHMTHVDALAVEGLSAVSDPIHRPILCHPPPCSHTTVSHRTGWNFISNFKRRGREPNGGSDLGSLHVFFPFIGGGRTSVLGRGCMLGGGEYGKSKSQQMQLTPSPYPKPFVLPQGFDALTFYCQPQMEADMLSLPFILNVIFLTIFSFQT